MLLGKAAWNISHPSVIGLQINRHNFHDYIVKRGRLCSNKIISRGGWWIGANCETRVSGEACIERFPIYISQMLKNKTTFAVARATNVPFTRVELIDRIIPTYISFSYVSDHWWHAIYTHSWNEGSIFLYKFDPIRKDTPPPPFFLSVESY